MKQRHWLSPLLLSAAAIMVACSGPAATPKPTPDFTTCQGFLDLAEVEEATGQNDLAIKINQPTETARKDNPAIRAVCVVSFQTPDSTKGITLTTVAFELATAAEEHYQTVVESVRQLPEFKEGALGPDSYQAVPDSRGIGSIVGFRKGSFGVALHTAMPEGEAPLASAEQLVELARLVRARLP